MIRLLGKLHSKDEKETGFTLIEMVVTVFIVMIITAIAITAYQAQRRSSIDSSVESDVKAAVTKVETWKISNPAGEPTQDIISGDYTEKDTVITLKPDNKTNGSNCKSTDYIIKGTNPKGKVSSGKGYEYSSCLGL